MVHCLQHRKNRASMSKKIHTAHRVQKHTTNATLCCEWMPLSKLSKMFRIASSSSSLYPFLSVLCVIFACVHLELKLSQYAPWLSRTFEMRNHSLALDMNKTMSENSVREFIFIYRVHWLQMEIKANAARTHTSYDDWLKSNIDTHVQRLGSGEPTHADSYIRLICASHPKGKVFQVNETRSGTEHAMNVLPAT